MSYPLTVQLPFDPNMTIKDLINSSTERCIDYKKTKEFETIEISLRFDDYYIHFNIKTKIKED